MPLTSNSLPETLTSQRLLIQKPHEGLAEALLDYRDGNTDSFEATPQTAYKYYTPLVKNIASARLWIKNRQKAWQQATTFDYCVQLKEGQQPVVGWIQLYNSNLSKDQYSLSYWLDYRHQGNGYATEACQKILEATDKVGMPLCLFIQAEENIPSIRLSARLGFKKINTRDYYRAAQPLNNTSPALSHT